MSACCHEEPEEPEEESSCCSPKRKVDWLLWGSLIVVAIAYAGHLLFHDALMQVHRVGHFTHGTFELMNRMWLGILIGIVIVGVLTRVPREFVVGILGKGGGFAGLLRATFAGLLLDLCNHGILMVGMQLYRRGASLGQTMAFLIASPWNSISLTIILFSLIGLKWTLLFILLSGVVALISGLIFESLVKAGKLPANPNSVELPEGFHLFRDARSGIRHATFNGRWFRETLTEGLKESRMVLRWIFFGVVLAALIRALIPSEEVFANWFGPTVMGLGLTLVAATIIEVCSEGSTPLAADLVTRGGAPGNGFTFLMSGAATDYTEIMSLKETTASWKIALALPAVTVPQVLVLGWVLNQFA